jgi:exonuclease VII small subunit
VKPCHRRDHHEITQLRGHLAQARAHHEAATIEAATLRGKLENVTVQLEQALAEIRQGWQVGP